jgi:hypothetical protein
VVLGGGLLEVVDAGGLTTGAGDDVVVTGGADWVVTGGVVAGCTGVVDLAVAALALWAVLWCFLRLVAGSDVVVVDVVDVVDALAAAEVELVFEAVVPPQPANASPTTIMLSSARFIVLAPRFAPRLGPRVQDTSGAASFR